MRHNITRETRKYIAERVYQRAAVKQAVVAVTETYTYEASIDTIADTVSRYDNRSYGEWLDQSEGMVFDPGMYW